jgi:formylglycine-generating enzyme
MVDALAEKKAEGTHRAPSGSQMVWIPGGAFRMSSDRHYPEEAPVHRVTVDGFKRNYCRRYRPAARHPQPVDTSASHVGFRCIIRERKIP